MLINSVEDHVHMLFELARTVSVSEAVEEVKKSSSKWIKTQGHEFAGFAWQAGYGAFAVSESNVPAVRDYIADQHEQHRRKSFQEEYRAVSHGMAWRLTNDMFGIRPPFQGFGLLGDIFPRTLPWAGVIRPFWAIESRTLAALLPKLLSGGLRVPDNLVSREL